MRSSLLLLIAATLAATKPIIFDDIIPSAEGVQSADTISGALDMVQGSVKSLDTSVKQVKPDNLGALGDVATKSNKLGTDIKAAQKMVEGAQQTDIFGALQIQDSATGLTDSINGLSKNLIAIKPTVDQAGLSPVVVSMLKMQQGQSGGLVKAVSVKVPSLVQDMAQEMGQQVTDALNRVVQAYMQPPVKAAGNSSIPANASTPSSTPAAAAAAA